MISRKIPRARRRLVALTVVLAGADLTAKAAAKHTLDSGRSFDLRVLELRLGFNSGAGFSLGASLPSWVVIAVTGAITLAIAVYAWRTAGHPDVSVTLMVGLSAVLAGAVGNLADRTGDGLVTDYLHTGWFPTFNLADVLITCGAIVIGALTLRAPRESRSFMHQRTD